jgi:signal peptidase II
LSALGKWPLVGSVAVTAAALDQATKWAAGQWLGPGGGIEVIPGFFDLVYIMNPGAAFGFLAGAGGWGVWILAGVGLAATALMLAFVASARDDERLFLWGLALVVGGALGNLIDRVRLRAVVDFILVHYRDWQWPAFNVADTAITVGVGLILIHLFKTRKDEAE